MIVKHNPTGQYHYVTRGEDMSLDLKNWDRFTTSDVWFTYHAFGKDNKMVVPEEFC